MSDVCSLHKRGGIECGPSRGRTETVFLYECHDDIGVHLKNCSLSRSNLKEYEVILQRAELDRMTPKPSVWLREVLEAVKVLPVSRAQRGIVESERA